MRSHATDRSDDEVVGADAVSRCSVDDDEVSVDTASVETASVETADDVTEVTDQVDGGRTSLAARGLTGVVRVYQYASAGRPSPCRHVPSCSTYAVEALEAHGAVRGSWLAVRRLGRCHPWGTSGYDPVPPPREARR